MTTSVSVSVSALLANVFYFQATSFSMLTLLRKQSFLFWCLTQLGDLYINSQSEWIYFFLRIWVRVVSWIKKDEVNSCIINWRRGWLSVCCENIFVPLFTAFCLVHQFIKQQIFSSRLDIWGHIILNRSVF